MADEDSTRAPISKPLKQAGDWQDMKQGVDESDGERERLKDSERRYLKNVGGGRQYPNCKCSCHHQRGGPMALQNRKQTHYHRLKFTQNEKPAPNLDRPNEKRVHMLGNPPPPYTPRKMGSYSESSHRGVISIRSDNGVEEAIERRALEAGALATICVNDAQHKFDNFCQEADFEFQRICAEEKKKSDAMLKDAMLKGKKVEENEPKSLSERTFVEIVPRKNVVIKRKQKPTNRKKKNRHIAVLSSMTM